MQKYRPTQYIFPIPLVMLCFMSCAEAETKNQYPRFSVSGFGTIGTIGTDTHTLGFYRDRAQKEEVTDAWGISTDSRLGIQIDAELSQTLHATIQYIARDHEGNFLEQNLEWAFLRWNPSDNLSIRLGRLGADVFFLSDYRNIGYTYPWMRPPHEFYANIPLYHMDGLDITRKFSFGEDLLSVKFFGAYSFNQFPAAELGVFNDESAIFGGNMIYESGNWRSRIGYAFIRFLSESPIQQLVSIVNMPVLNTLVPGLKKLAPQLGVKDTNVHFVSVGSSYDDGTWIMQAEASYTNSQIVVLPDAASAYLSVGRRFNKLTLYSLYGISESFEDHINIPKPTIALPQLQPLQQGLDLAINGNGTHEQSLSLGLRWDVVPNIALKTQWEHFWLGSNGSQLWEEPKTGNTPTQVNVWSVGLDFIF